MEPETREEYLERRLEQIWRGAAEAVRREVEWLRRHNFPVWVWREGRIVDAARDESSEPRAPADDSPPEPEEGA